MFSLFHILSKINGKDIIYRRWSLAMRLQVETYVETVKEQQLKKSCHLVGGSFCIGLDFHEGSTRELVMARGPVPESLRRRRCPNRASFRAVCRVSQPGRQA